jgi:3-oxoacyl-(acyl-carrier-protein) synthase
MTTTLTSPLKPARQYNYAFTATPDRETLDILGTQPTRWGRMPPLSRAMVVETGRCLKEWTMRSQTLPADAERTIGLIGGTTRGSLAPDLDFAATLLEGVNLASPAIFGYTLANIPLAEAANHYHLTGPVYAVLDAHAPLDAAIREARRLVRMRPAFHFILACAFDDDPGLDRERRLSLTFTLVDNNA